MQQNNIPQAPQTVPAGFRYGWVFLLYGLLSLSFNLFSQLPEPYSFNDLYDFDATNIYDLMAASNAHIWIATDEGLFRRGS